MKGASVHERTPQLSLFQARTLGGFNSFERVELDEHSWVEHFPQWLDRPEHLFTALAEHAAWEQRSRWMYTGVVVEPRLTAEYASIGEVPIPELQKVTAEISRHYGIVYDSLWLNWYRDHHDSTSWHADRPAHLLLSATVPVLSLGAPRRFLIRHREGGKSRTFNVESGDLVVMGGRSQRDWVHMVPKEAHPTGARISVNFGSSEQYGGPKAAASRPAK
ncbi:MAG: alpha-ketoglutarate-dependent dioxygenase AlkB [Myxococcales bacterium]